MSDYLTSPNMLLPVPIVSVEIGPLWAQDLNNCLSLIDQHDHGNGQGVRVNTSGLNINADLTFNGNSATSVQSVDFTSELATTLKLNSLYDVNGDLYFNDGSGNVIQFTSGGAINFTPTSIPGLVPPASLTYAAISQTFLFYSGVPDPNTPANVDVGNVILRDVSTPYNAVTISAPTPLGASYGLVVPASAPSVQSFVTMDAAGRLDAPWTVDGTTIKIIGNQLVASAGVAPTPPTVQKLTSTAGGDGYIFTLNAPANVTVGAVYNSSPAAHAYTVLATIAGGTKLWCSGFGGVANITTLTKSTGTGDTPLTVTSKQGIALYTTPTSPAPIYLNVRAVGAGGGGGGTTSGASATNVGTSGTATAFGPDLIYCGGGSGAPTSGNGGTGGVAEVGTSLIEMASINGSDGQGGPGFGSNLGGGSGGTSFLGGAGGGRSQNAGNGGAAKTNSGSGGGGTGVVTATVTLTSGGGGAGSYIEGDVDSPAAAYYYVVGAGGAGGTAGANGQTGGAGADGLIIVTEYYQ